MDSKPQEYSAKWKDRFYC